MNRKRRRKPCADEAEIIARSCTDKLQFPSEVMARMAARRFVYRTIRGRSPVKQMWVYQCKFCPGWHMTSQPNGTQMICV